MTSSPARWRHLKRNSLYTEINRFAWNGPVIAEGDSILLIAETDGWRGRKTSGGQHALARQAEAAARQSGAAPRLLPARVQAEHPVQAGETVLSYRGEDGRIWLRPVSEFEDGRFQRIA